MQNQSFEKIPYTYRPYYFPSDFPVWAFLGDYWKVENGIPQFLHFHNALEIGHCLNGKGSFLHRSVGEHPFHADDFSIIYPQNPHISYAENEPSAWEYMFIDLQKFANLNPVYPQQVMRLFFMPQRISPIINARNMPLLYSHLTQIFREMHEKKAFYQNAVSGLLLSVISELHHQTTLAVSSDSRESAHSYSYISSVLEYIYEHYKESLSISKLARYCHVSESHFRRLFHTIVGISPLDFIQHYRIQQACNLLQQNQLSVRAISEQVGYTTLSSFNRQFQQFMNCSPREWKKNHLAETGSHDVLSFDDDETKHIFKI